MSPNLCIWLSYGSFNHSDADDLPPKTIHFQIPTQLADVGHGHNRTGYMAAVLHEWPLFFMNMIQHITRRHASLQAIVVTLAAIGSNPSVAI